VLVTEEQTVRKVRFGMPATICRSPAATEREADEVRDTARPWPLGHITEADTANRQQEDREPKS
jgi:hypothetical protein